MANRLPKRKARRDTDIFSGTNPCQSPRVAPPRLPGVRDAHRVEDVRLALRVAAESIPELRDHEVGTGGVEASFDKAAEGAGGLGRGWKAVGDKRG